MTIKRRYSELKHLKSFEDRFEYLRLPGSVGYPTFEFDRYINQRFYTSTQWRQIRTAVIARDLGCDLGVPGYEIHTKVLVHHMNPLTPEDILHDDVDILDPEFLITTTHQTHNAIHYGDASTLPFLPPERRPGDMAPWRAKEAYR